MDDHRALSVGDTPVKRLVIERLFESFVHLERAIKVARETVDKHGDTRADTLARIDKYEEILTKQRSLATALCGYASMGKWEEVSRHIKLINGLSTMIRDDAKEIVLGLKKNAPVKEHELTLS